MINLEKRDVLKNKFKQKFHRRKPWKVDWSDYPMTDPAAGTSTGKGASKQNKEPD